MTPTAIIAKNGSKVAFFGYIWSFFAKNCRLNYPDNYPLKYWIIIRIIFFAYPDIRIIIHPDASSIRDLVEHPHWGMDGTFRVAPACFYQLETIHVHLGEY